MFYTVMVNFTLYIYCFMMLFIILLQVQVMVSCVSKLDCSKPTCGFADPAATSSSNGKLCQ